MTQKDSLAHIHNTVPCMMYSPFRQRGCHHRRATIAIPVHAARPLHRAPTQPLAPGPQRSRLPRAPPAAAAAARTCCLQPARACSRAAHSPRPVRQACGTRTLPRGSAGLPSTQSNDAGAERLFLLFHIDRSLCHIDRPPLPRGCVPHVVAPCACVCQAQQTCSGRAAPVAGDLTNSRAPLRAPPSPRAPEASVGRRRVASNKRAERACRRSGPGAAGVATTKAHPAAPSSCATARQHAANSKREDARIGQNSPLGGCSEPPRRSANPRRRRRQQTAATRH